MATQKQIRMTPELKRALFTGLAIEAPFFIAAIAVMFITHNYLWFVALVVMGMAAFMACFFPAYFRATADAAREDSQSPIVEDPNGRP